MNLPAAGRDARLRVIVGEARIESRFQTLDHRASIFEFLASIRASSPLNNILLDPKPNGLLDPNLIDYFHDGDHL